MRRKRSGGCRTASGGSKSTSNVQERPRRDCRRRKAELERSGRSSGDGSGRMVAGGPMFRDRDSDVEVGKTRALATRAAGGAQWLMAGP